MSSRNCSKSVCQFYLIWKYRELLKHHGVFVSFFKFEVFTTFGTLIRGGVAAVQNLLQFSQLFHCIQHIVFSCIQLYSAV